MSEDGGAAVALSSGHDARDTPAVGVASSNEKSTTHRLAGVKTINAAVVRERFDHALEAHRPEMGRFFLAHFLGFQFDYTDDSCTIRFDVHDFMCNPKGTLHGGIIATALDTSMGHLVAHLHAPASTVEMKTQYLRAVKPGPCEVKATVLKRGKSLWFLEASLYNAEGDRAAFATATWAA